MQPVTMPHTTAELAAPRDWDAGQLGPCLALPITRDGEIMYSYWRPTWRDWFRVLFGKPIRLSVAGYAHPPMMLDTED